MTVPWFVLLVVGAGDWNADIEALKVIDRFEATWRTVSDITYTMDKVERLRGGEVTREKIFVKLAKPGRVYVASLEPESGQEVIYHERRDAKNLVVHPGRFPDFTLRLDIHGKLATRDQHHVITHHGHDYLLSVIRRFLNQAYQRPSGERVKHLGTSVVDGVEVERVVLTAGSNPHRSVKAKKGETLLDFAARVKMDAYLILYVNSQIARVTSELEAGRLYWVPSYYGSKLELVIDRKLGLPIRQIVMDFEGQEYERYDIRKMRKNPGLKELDFDPDNPAYDF